ncbi:MAG: (2Fe-2S)-binding protein [Dehalococcoidia bacterium]
MRIALEVNGSIEELDVEPQQTLLDLLHANLDLRRTKRVCDVGECGACTILVDGLPVYACILLAISCRDRHVETIEAQAPNGRVHPLQAALVAADALQCGFCAPAWTMALKPLLSPESIPAQAEVQTALSGVCCRCGANAQRIQKAVQGAKSPSEERS